MGSSFHPPTRPEPKNPQPRSWYEEMLEKDELLLYVTAILGVVLPGIVYLVYQRVHAVYMKYAAKKEAEMRAEEAAKCEILLIQLGAEEGASKRFSTRVANFVQKETTVAPKEWASTTMKTSQLSNFRGVVAFISDPKSEDESAWLLDWMEEVAADPKTKKKAKFEDIRFAVVGFSEGKDTEEKDSKIAKTIARRMKILGSKQLLPVALFTEPLADDIFSQWCDVFLDEVEKSLRPEEEPEESAGESTDESELESDDEREVKKNL